MLGDIGKAAIVITNYHAFQHRETLELSRVGRAFLQGNAPEPIEHRETDGQMLDVLAESCCRSRTSSSSMTKRTIAIASGRCRRREKLDREAGRSQRQQRGCASVDSGIEALKRKVGLRARLRSVGDPFFLRGSGYQEGTLFPWVVSTSA